MLKQQQAWLVHGLQELYRLTTECEGWPGYLLNPEPNGHPLIHNLLTRLSALDESKGERLEETSEIIQHDFWRNGAAHHDSTEGSIDSPHSPVARSLFSSDAFSSHPQQSMLPTAPNYARGSRAAPMQHINVEPAMKMAPLPRSQYALSMQGVVNPLVLQDAPQWPRGNGGSNPFDEISLINSADYTNFNFADQIPSSMFHRQIRTNCLPCGYDDFKAFLNPNPDGDHFALRGVRSRR
jgi:hypothetical protein